MEEQVLLFDSVSFRYGPSLPEIIHDISFTLRGGTLTSLVGQSGSGKSTVLRIAAGLSIPTSGKVIAPKKTRMVFQDGALLPWRTVLENVRLGFTGLKLSVAEETRRARKELTMLGIGEHADSFPKDLSGGQRQRVGIARALVSCPDLLLLDEPFSALDAETSRELGQELLSVLERQQITMLMVSHSIEDAVLLSDTIFVCKDGVFESTIPVALPHPRRPEDPTVMKLVAHIKKLLPSL